MDRASSLIYPGSRTLAGWWRQLALRQPLAIGVGYGFLHRVEAPVSVICEEPIDPLAHYLLQALALEEPAGTRAAQLQERLHLPAAIVQRVLAGMSENGLVARTDADCWQMSERGRHALQHRSFPARIQKRHVFPFFEHLDPAGQRLGPPLFAPFAECVGVPWSVDESHRMDSDAVLRFLEQSQEWKQKSALPLDIQALTPGAVLGAWQQVVIDRPERVMLVLIVVAGDRGKDVLGFAVKADGWTLFDRTPVLQVPAPADAVCPELTQAPPMLVWQDAWRNWCKQRQLPTNEVEICALTYQPPRLEVQAPPRLVQRLQAAKSDLFKGDAWILVGEGYMRTAVQLAIK